MKAAKALVAAFPSAQLYIDKKTDWLLAARLKVEPVLDVRPRREKVRNRWGKI